MRVNVLFHGALKGTSIEIEAETPAEAIDGATRQIPALKQNNGRRWTFKAVGYSIEELYGPLKGDVLRLMPTFSGGKSGFFRIIIGAALIAVSFAIGGPAGSFAALVHTTLFSLGVSLVLGGIASFLAPTPKQDLGSSQEGSKYLGSSQNTVKIGTRVPIFFGRARAYGQYVSFDVQSIDVGV